MSEEIKNHENKLNLNHSLEKTLKAFFLDYLFNQNVKNISIKEFNYSEGKLNLNVPNKLLESKIKKESFKFKKIFETNFESLIKELLINDETIDFIFTKPIKESEVDSSKKGTTIDVNCNLFKFKEETVEEHFSKKIELFQQKDDKLFFNNDEKIIFSEEQILFFINKNEIIISIFLKKFILKKINLYWIIPFFWTLIFPFIIIRKKIQQKNYLKQVLEEIKTLEMQNFIPMNEKTIFFIKYIEILIL